jgi:hypothetical protein
LTRLLFLFLGTLPGTLELIWRPHPPAVAVAGHAVARGAHAGGAGERWLLGGGVGGAACTATQSHRAAAAQASIALLAVARQLLMRYPRCACLLEEEGDDDVVSRSCACIGSPCLRHCGHGASIGGGHRPRPRPGRGAQPGGGGGHQRPLLPGGGDNRHPPSLPPSLPPSSRRRSLPAAVLTGIYCGGPPRVSVARARRASEQVRAAAAYLSSPCVRHWGWLGGAGPRQRARCGIVQLRESSTHQPRQQRPWRPRARPRPSSLVPLPSAPAGDGWLAGWLEPLSAVPGIVYSAPPRSWSDDDRVCVSLPPVLALLSLATRCRGVVSAAPQAAPPGKWARCGERPPLPLSSVRPLWLGFA